MMSTCMNTIEQTLPGSSDYAHAHECETHNGSHWVLLTVHNKIMYVARIRNYDLLHNCAT